MATAHARLSAAATRSVPSSPICGRSSQLPQSAPTAAPNVFSVYSHPAVVAARLSVAAMPRVNSGSEAPIKNVGQRSAANRMAAVGVKPISRCPHARVQEIVKNRPTDRSEQGDRTFGRREQDQTRASADPIGHPSADETAAPQAGHEGRDNDGGGEDVAAGKDHEHALPDDLVEQAGEARQAEHDEGHGHGARLRLEEADVIPLRRVALLPVATSDYPVRYNRR